MTELTKVQQATRPFMHGISDPDGNPYFDECCVGDAGLMRDEVAKLNIDLEDGDSRYSVVALYREPVPDKRDARIAELEAQLAELRGQEPVATCAVEGGHMRADGFGECAQELPACHKLADGAYELFVRRVPPAASQLWFSVANGQLPDANSEKRVCAYTPTEHGDFRYRSIPASLFKAVCSDATHWHYFTLPEESTASQPYTVPDELRQWVDDVVEYLNGGLETDGDLEAEGSIEAKRLLACRAAMLQSGNSPIALNDDLQSLIMKHRIAVTPEYEGGWNADIYGEEAEIQVGGYGDTPLEAVRNAFACGGPVDKDDI